MLANNKLFYVGNLTGKVLNNFNASDVKYNDLASTYTYYFNMAEGRIGSNATIRKALSLALDRNAIATELNNGSKAATGLVPGMIFDTKKGTSFREAGGDIMPTGDAKAMLASEGIDPSKYEPIFLYYITDTTNDSYQSAQWGYTSKEKTIALAAKKAWEALGFKVVVKGVTAAEHAAVYANGQYDVIGLDYHMPSAYIADFIADLVFNLDLIKCTDSIIYRYMERVCIVISVCYTRNFTKAFLIHTNETS
jgi:ABC-type oligopeptide transport system substrate-binding subunit